MCEKCDAIDEKLRKFESHFSPALDPFTRSLIQSTMDTLKVEKAAIGCEPNAPKQ